jgi:hypothetical protein
LAILNDKHKKVKVFFDINLYEGPWINFPPMDQTAMTYINKEGIDKIRKLHGGQFMIFDFENSVEVNYDEKIIEKDNKLLKNEEDKSDQNNKSKD